MNPKALKIERLATEELVELAGSLTQELARRSGVAPAKKALYYTPCPKCGDPVSWLTTESGAKVALDDKPGPYIVVDGIAKHVGGAGEYAFHFDTCRVQNAPSPPPPPSRFDQVKKDLGWNDEDPPAAETETREHQGGETNESTD